MLKRRSARDEIARQERAAITSRSDDVTPIALVGCDVSGHVISWNRAATRLLGWRQIDVIGRRVLEIFGRDLLIGVGAQSILAQAATSYGSTLDVELLTDGETASRWPANGAVFAVIPTARIASRLASDASPRIENWAEAATAIHELGGTVQCFAIGLVGVTAVNRGYSRSTGDAVLREVLQRLGRLAGPGGRAIRIAGTQFLIVTPEAHVLDGERIVHEMSVPIETKLGPVRIAAHVGIATGEARSAYVLLDRTDSAIRSASLRGVGAVERSPGEGSSPDTRHPRLSSLLIDAVAKREIGVQFQPVVDLVTGTVVEFEALARWTSLELGEVDPSMFIEAAEDAGLIHELGRCVVDAALDVVVTERMAGRWGDARVSVNLSAVQLAHPDLVNRLHGALTARSLTGDVLQIELTETRPVPTHGAAATNLAALRELRVRVAVDDFGTGCANLSYLRDLPVDAIKIDRRYVDGVSTSRADAAIIRSIISVASDLRIDVIAEGVETPEQHLALLRLGCPKAQGFLYAPPRTVDDLHLAIVLPQFHRSTSNPYPVDELGRLQALHSADVLDATPQQEYDDIVRAAAELCGAPMAMVSLIDSDTHWVKAHVGLFPGQMPRELSFCTHAICRDELMEVIDARADERFATNPAVTGEIGLRFYAGMPLHGSSGHNYGALCVMDLVPRSLTDAQREGLTRLARQATMMIDLRRQTNAAHRAENRLEVALDQRDAAEDARLQQASRDSLTGLMNRSSLLARLEATLARAGTADAPVALLVCDLDEFGRIDRTLGHLAGDRILRHVAGCIEECVRSTETVARMAGDQFLVLVPDSALATLEALANRIMRRVAEPISMQIGDRLTASLSIGIATHRSGQGADGLLRDAHAALDAAKQLGGGRTCLFDDAHR